MSGYDGTSKSTWTPGVASACCAIPRIAALVHNAFLFFHEKRYDLHAWVVMPNHVHVLFRLRPGHALSEVVQSWNSRHGEAGQCDSPSSRTVLAGGRILTVIFATKTITWSVAPISRRTQ